MGHNVYSFQFLFKCLAQKDKTTKLNFIEKYNCFQYFPIRNRGREYMLSDIRKPEKNSLQLNNIRTKQSSYSNILH